MSHIVSIRTEIKDLAAVRAACVRLGLSAPVDGTHKLFNDQQAIGYAVRLNGWLYPAVVDLTSGGIQYDNFGGSWGADSELARFKQAYAIEKAKLEARKLGHNCREQVLADGSIKLTINA
jgi:hypothetical protein